MKITIEKAVKLIESHNKEIDTVIKNVIPDRIHIKSDCVLTPDNVNDVFKIMKEHKFYEKGRAIAQECRNNNFDVRIDIYTYKLMLLGLLNL